MSQFWTILDAAGEVLCPSFETTDADAHPRDYGWPWQDGQQAIAVSFQPDPVVDEFAGSEWIKSLTVARARKRDEIKARRDQAEWGGCTSPLGRVDTDPDSQRKVGGAVQMAMIAQAAGAPFSISWTMADNSSVAHDAPAMILMGLAVGQHVAACHAVGVGKQQAVDAATTVEAVDAVDLDGGWPDA